VRDYTTAKFQHIQEIQRSGMMVGRDRPVTRATWCKQSIRQIHSTKDGMGAVRYLDKNPTQFEFTGIASVEIQRSIGQDAATCTITLWNTHNKTSQPEGIDTEGRKGYLTPGRGAAIQNLTSVYTGTDTDLGMTDSDAQLVLPTSWGYPENPYRDVFIPNTVIRTYQGYGSDNFDSLGNEIYMHDPSSEGYVPPEADTKLYQTGTWLIDQVTIHNDGTMQLECRDLAKLLIEQFIYPPLLPIDRFPLIYCPAHKDMGHKEVIGKNVATYHSASTDRRYGKNGKVLGHRARDAFDGRKHTFWLSGANTVGSNLEWLQAKVHGEINEIVLNCYGGNYLVYVCVHSGGKWQGTSTVAGNSENLDYYDSPGDGAGFMYVITSGDTLWDLAGHYYGDNFKWPIIARANNNIIKDPHWIYPGQRIKIPYVKGTLTPPPTGGTATGGTHVDIPYVITATVPSNGKATITLPKTYKANFVRVVFTNLNPSLGEGSPYRAGVREMVVRNHIPNTFLASTEGKGGSINDWTEPIKEMCAWAGLTWEDAPTADPVIGSTSPAATIAAYQKKIMVLRKQLQSQTWWNAGQKAAIINQINDLNARITTLRARPVVNLRVWGDFEILGAGPIVCTPGDYFMSKSFMDGIGLIRDFIGGIFFIDETGGAQFRLPNIWTAGNFIDDIGASTALKARVAGHPIEFHEDVNLISYQMTISDADVRSEVLVVGGYPKSTSAPAPVAGGYVLGYNSETGQTSAIDFTDVLAGQYRLMIVPGESTNLFYTERECQRMAELTALFILFTYRTGSAKIVAHPGLQIDDQVRIFERTSYETNIHYVSGVTSTHNLESGEYTMDVTCHWLGGDPNTEWFVNKQTLTPAVTTLPAILKRVGKEAAGGPFEQPEYGT